MTHRTAGTSYDRASLPPLLARVAASDRARHAIDLALHCLGGIEPTKDVLDLVERAKQLRDEVAQWSARPPSSEMREAAMRGAMSIQVGAMTLLQKGRRGNPTPV